MSARKFGRAFLFLCVSAAMVASLLGFTAVAEPAQQPSRRAVGRLEGLAGTPLDVAYDARYGNVTFLMGGMPFEASAPAKGDALATAIEFLAQNPGLYQMTDPAQELTLVRTTSDSGGDLHVRLAQLYHGVPVFNRSLYVHLDALGNVIGTNGHYVPGLRLGTTPALSAATAESIALRDVASPGAVVRQPTTLGVYLDEYGEAHLTWRVETFDAGAPSRAYYYVEARGGAIAHVTDMLMTARDRLIYDAQNTESLPGEEVAREGERPREASAKAAYENSGLTYDYYANTFNRDSFDDRGSTIVSTVHFGENYSNAYWDGTQMVYGDGDVEVTQPYVMALDVDAHELTHAVTQYTANMEYELQSGALNEHYSDAFAAMIDREDWQMGEDIWNPDYWPTPYLRDMEDPSLGGYYNPDRPMESAGQPSKMSEYANLPTGRRNDNGGVHINSGIPNHALYLAVEASSREAMEQVWYKVLTTRLTETSDFSDFVTNTLDVAKKDYGANSTEYKAIVSAFDETELTGNVPEPTPPPSPTPRKSGTTVPVPTPDKTTGCTELIQNPGFEKGSGEPWVEYTSLSVAIIGEEWPHTGKRSAWLGGSDEETFHYIYQDVAIPANAKTASLTYWYYLHEEFSADDSPAESNFSVLIANTDGDILANLETMSSTQANEAWEQSTLDAKKYAGKTIRLAFTAEMATGNISSWFVDDVSLQSCTSSSTRATPTPKPPAEGIQVSGHIYDYNTGDGVEGAKVFFLDPDITASQAADDNRVTQDEVFTYGVTDRDGYYELEDLLDVDTVYSVIVIADGYYAIIADYAIDTTGWPSVVTDVDGQMQPAQ